MKHTLGAVCALFVLVSLAGCSLLVDVDDECSADTDCADGLRCERNLCTGCSTDAHCADGRCLEDRCVPCIDNLDCDPGFICVETACVATTPPEECNHFYGVPREDIFTEGVVRLGMLMPTSGDLGEVGLAIEQAAALALDEINSAGGLDGHPIAIIACDTGTLLLQAIKGATWLIQEARVPAIIGPATSSNTIGVFTSIARESGTLLISPSATSRALTDLEDDDLLWRTVVSDDIQSRAIFAYLEDRDFQKIAMIHLNDTYGQGLRDGVLGSLCEIERCDSDSFLALPYDADAQGNVTLDSVNQIMAALQDFDPEVIILVGFVNAGGRLLASAANSGFENTPFILTDGLREDALFETVPSDALLSRVLGTAAASADTNYEVFASAYRGRYRHEPGVYNAQAYDATYLLALALAGAQGDYTGPVLATQLKRMSSGETINARSVDFNKGVRILRGSPDATIDFNGASGELDFDDATGDALADIEGWYFDLETRMIASHGVIYTSDGTYRAPMTAAPPDME